MAVEDDQPVKIKKLYGGLSLSAEITQSIYSDVLQNHIDTHLNIMKFGREWARKSHTVAIPKPETLRGEYDDFVVLWRQVTEYALERDFLIDNYEGMELAEFQPNVYETVYDETEEEWEARKATLPATVTFPVTKRRDDV